MDWTDEIRDKIRRKNQILFSKDSPFLADLADIIGAQNHRTVVLWALELAGEAVSALLDKYPEEKRPSEALLISEAWAKGQVKMPVAQKAILACHAFAKEIDAPEDIALCHAIGQACGSVHTTGHALGFPIYELTAIIRQYGLDAGKEIVQRRKAYYIERILYWGNNYKNAPQDWARFMLK